MASADKVPISPQQTRHVFNYMKIYNMEKSIARKKYGEKQPV